MSVRPLQPAINPANSLAVTPVLLSLFSHDQSIIAHDLSGNKRNGTLMQFDRTAIHQPVAAYASNPVLEDTPNGAVDPGVCPTKVGGYWYMGYTGDVGLDTSCIGIARSSDLRTWTNLYHKTPQSGYREYAPDFYYAGGVWYMAYNRDHVDSPGVYTGVCICLETCADIEANSWSAPSALLSGSGIYDPSPIVKVGSTYYLFHSYNDGTLGIGVSTATSLAGPYANTRTATKVFIEAATVFLYAGRYYMIGMCLNYVFGALLVADTTDLATTTWTAVESGAGILPFVRAAWEAHGGRQHPNVILDADGVPNLFWSAANASDIVSIGCGLLGVGDVGIGAVWPYSATLYRHYLEFNGHSYVTLPAAVLAGLGDFTVAFWMRCDVHGPANTDQILYSWVNISQYNAAEWVIYVNYNYAARVTSPVGEWHHVTVTRSGSTCSRYLDGSLVGTANVGSDPIASMPVRLGQDIYGSYFTGGMIDLVVEPRALTQTEITALATAANPSLAVSDVNLLIPLDDDCSNLLIP